MSQQIQVEVRRLRPTQITVSMAHVSLARAQIRAARARHQLQDFLTWRRLSGVLGPRGEVFVIDSHPLARALADEAVEHCIVLVQQDLSNVMPDRFWVVMERSGWVQPVDAAGRRRSFSALARDFSMLEDDPYRTLALRVREAGACDEWESPAAELTWADFLRTCVPRELLAADRDEPVRLALQHARSDAARRLPGWKGK